MQSRRCLIVLAAMLLVLSATAIVTAQDTQAPAEQVNAETTPVTDTAADQVEAETLMAEPTACHAQVQSDPFEASQTAGYTDTCGSCSVSQCRGLARGTYCAPGKYCIPTDTMFCPGTDDWDCQCARYYN